MTDQVYETEVEAQIYEWLGSRTWARCWPAKVAGTFRALYSNRVVSIPGLGKADLTGILQDGKRLEVEVKRPGGATVNGRAREPGKQQKNQIAFQQMIERFNGIYLVVTSVEDCKAQLEARGYSDVGNPQPSAAAAAPPSAGR